jgi:hypothetical protein
VTFSVPTGERESQYTSVPGSLDSASTGNAGMLYAFSHLDLVGAYLWKTQDLPAAHAGMRGASSRDERCEGAQGLYAGRDLRPICGPRFGGQREPMKFFLRGRPRELFLTPRLRPRRRLDLDVVNDVEERLAALYLSYPFCAIIISSSLN